jgi:uncharacterized membrane protein
MPVGLPAAALYLAVAAAAPAAVRAAGFGRRTPVSAGMWLAAGAILTAVCWFIGLQAIELRIFCPWCLADHALGAATALAVLLNELRQRRFRPLLFLAGMGLTVLLAATQILLPSAESAPAQLNAQQVELLEGRLQVDLSEAPTLGAAPVVMLFDYCCPHCRQTHTHLLQLQAAHPDRFTLVVLPVPLNAECNAGVEETEPRFASACDLARLALAVWRADRARFVEFDQWLFASEQPRSAAEARTEAERLVTPAALSAALVDPWIESRLRANVEAFSASGLDTIPVLLAPGRGGVSGRVADAVALRALLTRDLGIALE